MTKGFFFLVDCDNIYSCKTWQNLNLLEIKLKNKANVLWNILSLLLKVKIILKAPIKAITNFSCRNTLKEAN